MDSVRTSATADYGEWLLPDEKEPPINTKLLNLTRYRVLHVGTWDPSFVAWMPLPKISDKVKNRLAELTYG